MKFAMIQQPGNYVSQNAEGSWQIYGTRVSLDSVVHAYREGCAAEQIGAGIDGNKKTAQKKPQANDCLGRF